MQIGHEDIILINVINWFKYNYPNYAQSIHHFANERKCSIQQGRLLKRKGVSAGVADIHIAIPTKNYHGLWIELKVNNGKLSKAQQAFLDEKTKYGYCALATWGEEPTKEFIKTYLET